MRTYLDCTYLVDELVWDKTIYTQILESKHWDQILILSLPSCMMLGKSSQCFLLHLLQSGNADHASQCVGEDCVSYVCTAQSLDKRELLIIEERNVIKLEEVKGSKNFSSALLLPLSNESSSPSMNEKPSIHFPGWLSRLCACPIHIFNTNLMCNFFEEFSSAKRPFDALEQVPLTPCSPPRGSSQVVCSVRLSNGLRSGNGCDLL